MTGSRIDGILASDYHNSNAAEHISIGHRVDSDRLRELSNCLSDTYAVCAAAHPLHIHIGRRDIRYYGAECACALSDIALSLQAIRQLKGRGSAQGHGLAF